MYLLDHYRMQFICESFIIEKLPLSHAAPQRIPTELEMNAAKVKYYMQ